jgi:hypothetical protein
MVDLTILERQVLETLLPRDGEVSAILREQVKGTRVSSREMTGVGFFAHLEVSEKAPRVPVHSTLKLGAVKGTADNIKHGFGFLLYLSNGVRNMLEGYAYDEPWPDDVQGLVLTDSGDGKIDF